MPLTGQNIATIEMDLREWVKGLSRGNSATREEGKEYFNPTHKATSKQAEHLSYHAEFGVFPEALISAAAPNESEEEFRYRKATYRQVTKPVWDKALSFVFRIWNQQNWGINWPEDKDVRTYITEEFPVYGDYVEFFRDVVTKLKFADPNAVIAIKPAYIPLLATGEVDENGDPVMEPDQAQPIDPVAALFKSYQVFDYVEGKYALLLMDTRVPVNKGGKDVNEGYLFELYDDTYIWRLRQTGKFEDGTFLLEEYYEHKWGMVPAFRLRGIPVHQGGAYYFHSYFSGALPNLDTAAVVNSTLLSCVNKTAFPQRWMIEDECRTCDGEGWILNDNDERVGCQACGGSGGRVPTWGKDYSVKMPENASESSRFSEFGFPFPPFGVVNPETGAVEFLDAKVKSLLDTAFLNLNIDVASQPNGQTATESKIDREEAFSFLMQVSAELFALLDITMEAITWMRWMPNKTEEVSPYPVVNAPNEFTIRSSAALTDEIARAQEARLPASWTTRLVAEGMSQRFNDDKHLERLTEVVHAIDPLATKTELDINSMLGTGRVAKWQAVLHDNIYVYIGEEEAKDPGFLMADTYETIKPTLEEKAKAQAAATTVGQTADQIIDSLATPPPGGAG